MHYEPWSILSFFSLLFENRDLSFNRLNGSLPTNYDALQSLEKMLVYYIILPSEINVFHMISMVSKPRSQVDPENLGLRAWLGPRFQLNHTRH
jgi:hypothetical protein